MSQTQAAMETIEVQVSQIKPSPYQPRLTFNLEDLRGSIQRDGILVPLTVRKKDGYYELIDGERRVRLAKELGYKTIPCTVIDVDDETARRMVWKVNTLRQEYTPKEKAYYFRKLQDEYGMSFRGIARECDEDQHNVIAHLNVFKLPEQYQRLIWESGMPLTVGHIRVLETLFNSGVGIPTIAKRLDQVINQKLTVEELRGVVKPDFEEIRQRRIESAREVVKEVAPVPEIKLETPEELEDAAKVLRREAERRKTPEQRQQELIDNIQASLNSFPSLDDAKKLGISTALYKEKLQEIRSYMKENPEKAADAIRTLKRDFVAEKRRKERERREAKIIEKARKEAEAEMLKKAKEEAEKRLLEDQEFMERAATEAIKRMQTTPEPIAPLPMPPSPEQFEAMRKSMQEVQEKTRAILEKPEVKEHGRLFRNWLGHEAILNVLGSVQCPECGSDWTNLVWKCHNLNLKDSYERAHAKYQKAILEQKKRS